jgi:hypothetical protein
VLEIQDLLTDVLGFVLFAVKAFALVDCAVRKAGDFDFELSSPVSKSGWLVILGLSAVGHLVTWGNPLRLLNLAGTVAALVYLAQLRARTA